MATALVGSFALLLAGCAATKVQLHPYGGSKGDGTVTLGIEYGGFSRVEWQWIEAQQTAAQRCRAWGYSDAQRFNNGTNTCLQWNQYGCLRHRVIVQYQCIDG